MNCDVVVLAVPRQISILKINIPYIWQSISPRRIVIIAPEQLRMDIQELGDNFIFICEDNLLEGLSYKAIEKLISNRDSLAVARTGWYFQQFLKMAYSFICPDDYYFVLDADTIPVRKLDMFSSNKIPFFDIKTEYNAPYFATMKKIIGMTKSIDGSFISEHMLFNTKYMKELIHRIEDNSNVEGIYFFEKVINAIRTVDLLESGFSEFETYGTFVLSTYPNSYELRYLQSLRNGSQFLGSSPDAGMLKWASEFYTLISFENHHPTKQKLLEYVKQNRKNRRLDDIVRETESGLR